MAAMPTKMLLDVGIKFISGPYTVHPVALFFGTHLMNLAAKLLNCKIEIDLKDPEKK